MHWPLLLDVPGQPPAQRARAIDGRLPNSLIHLPLDLTGAVDEDDQASLAVRDLVRGTATGLPSGEAVARRVGATPLAADEIGLADLGWTGETPLWYYLLREAAVLEDGERLGAGRVADRRRGPAGGDRRGSRVAAIGGPRLEADPARRASPVRFTLTDLLAPA